VRRTSHFRVVPVALVSSVFACSAAPISPPPEGSGSSPGQTAGAASNVGPSQHVDSLETGVPGERFAPLDVGTDRLSGVFNKDGESLVFDVQHVAGGSALRLSTAWGEPLYSQVQGPAGIEMRVGSTYRSLLPVVPGAALPSRVTSSPAGFQSSGDLKAAFEALKLTPFALLPHLSAALGRVGLTGSRARTAMAIHATAMLLTEALGLDMDGEVRIATNQWIAANAAAKGGLVVRPALESPTPSAAPQTSVTEHTDGLLLTTPLQCPLGKPPCNAPAYEVTSGLLAGCCVMPAPTSVPRDYSNTPECHSGVGREPLNSLAPDDPCKDSCLGMCGPGCIPWDWVCGDESVHTACWRHDSVPWSSWYDVIFWAEYGAYSTWIFTDTEAAGLCENTWLTDYLTDPAWYGLSANHPGYFDYDPSN
jgi:hypothetical protein